MKKETHIGLGIHAIHDGNSITLQSKDGDKIFMDDYVVIALFKFIEKEKNIKITLAFKDENNES